MGAPLVTIGLFIFAWTVYPDVHWIGPIIGSGVFGAGHNGTRKEELGLASYEEMGLLSNDESAGGVVLDGPCD
ncbi:hypothetical protein PENCOP_c002G06436 [Penicillium coprophilum]|uniref:Uncharacterized protein n=1 Tax=Penicillium coprophilum TaxID=36646 RepID=A0A1V6V1A3_9EURO|nr:hypothetical protein PENCOP_c002G06436 [Penicillium coprophilum]